MIEFSVVIPTFNRPQSLSRCLECLYASNYPVDRFEIVVVDDGSRESYAQIREAYPELVWLSVPNGGPALARNHGVERARGKYLAFTDDDCYVHPDWLLELEKGFARFPDALVGGLTPPYSGAGVYDKVSQFITSLVYTHYNREPENAGFFASNNLAVSRATFEAVGGFQTEFTRNAAEDRSLCNRVNSHGFRLVWLQDAVVYHHPQLDFKSFCWMYFRYGRGAFTYQRGRQSGSMLSEMSFHANLPGIVWQRLAEEPELSRMSTFFLLGVWQVCNLAGFLWQVFQGDNY